MGEYSYKTLTIRAALLSLGILTYCGTSISFFTLSSAPAQAGTADDLYAPPGIACDPERAGKPEGPVIFTSDRLNIAGITCKLSSKTGLSRMKGYLMDANCKMGRNINKRTRMYFAKTGNTLVVHSDALGVFVLHSCPEINKSPVGVD